MKKPEEPPIVSSCQICDSMFGKRRETGLGVRYFCNECQEDWLSGMYDEDPPPELDREE